MLYVSVLVGGIAAYALGVIWYMTLAKPWMKAAGVTDEQVNGGSQRDMIITYGSTLIAWLIVSFVLQAHLHPLFETAGVNIFRATVGMWICFGLLSTFLSTLYGARGLNLLWIDGLYVLGGGLLIGLSYTFIAP